jgi:glycosyltransferase involved in cell wall biosynthesis
MHVVVNGWFWGQMNTGSGQYLHGLAQYLTEAGPAHRYTLVLPAAHTTPAPAGWQVEAATPAARLLGANLAKLWFEQVTFPRACQRLNADIAFTPYWGSPWRRPCPTAVTVHDLIPLLLPAYRGGVLQRTYTWLVSQTARRADLVLTDSQASRQDIVQNLRVPVDRVRAVLLAADERFQPVTDPAVLARVRERYALPDQFILYLGGFDVRKNVAGLVRAYARWAQLETSFFLENDVSESPHSSDMSSFGKDDMSHSPHLVIAGKLPTADTPFTPDPRHAATDAGVADRVRFTGWVDEADKPALYSLASLFVFPSLYEGYGLPVAEAEACGAPIVTSKRSSLPEVAPAALLVNPEDPEALAAAMARALAAPRPPFPAQRRTWLDVARETLIHLEKLS